MSRESVGLACRPRPGPDGDCRHAGLSGGTTPFPSTPHVSTWPSWRNYRTPGLRGRPSRRRGTPVCDETVTAGCPRNYPVVPIIHGPLPHIPSLHERHLRPIALDESAARTRMRLCWHNGPSERTAPDSRSLLQTPRSPEQTRASNILSTKLEGVSETVANPANPRPQTGIVAPPTDTSSPNTTGEEEMLSEPSTRWTSLWMPVWSPIGSAASPRSNARSPTPNGSTNSAPSND